MTKSTIITIQTRSIDMSDIMFEATPHPRILTVGKVHRYHLGLGSYKCFTFSRKPEQERKWKEKENMTHYLRQFEKEIQ